jgi:hypothetical protein
MLVSPAWCCAVAARLLRGAARLVAARLAGVEWDGEVAELAEHHHGDASLIAVD